MNTSDDDVPLTEDEKDKLKEIIECQENERKWLRRFDTVLGHLLNVRPFGLYLLVQCVIGISAFVVILTNLFGQLSSTLFNALLDYFFPVAFEELAKKAAHANSTHGCQGFSTNYFSLGVSTLTLFTVLAYYGVLKILLYVRTGSFVVIQVEEEQQVTKEAEPLESVLYENK